MKSLLKKLTGRRARKVYLWGGICLVTLTVLFYQIANWRGARAWKLASERLDKEGERLSMSDLAPEKIPDPENFFATPSLLDIAKVDGDDADTGPHAEKRQRLVALNPRRAVEGIEAKPPKRGRGSLVPEDFAGWVEYASVAGTLDLDGADGDTPAARILSALDSTHGPLFDELIAASARPHSTISPTFDQLAEGKRFYNVSVPHYTGLQSLAAALSLRATAAAQAGDAHRATESLVILAKLAEGCRKDPILIGILVAMAFDEMRHRALWEMVRAGTYDAESLERLQRVIAGIDLQAAILNGIRGELLGGLDAMDWIDDDGISAEMISGVDGQPKGGAATLANLTPSGWIDQNRSYFATWYLDYAILPLKHGDLAGAVAKADELDQLITARRKGWIHPHKVMPMIAMPVINAMMRRVVHAEANRRIELLACALGRYRLDTGAYPETLDPLTPKFIAELPQDPCATGGGTLGYRKDGERYRIWSIALDGDDDGGVPDKDSKKRPTRTKYDGDWVWRFAE